MRSLLRASLVAVGLAILSCAPPPAPAAPVALDETGDKRDIGAVLDDFNDAAARADEDRYFGHLTDASIFLGTDATERWDKAAFRKFAHPFFAKGKAWDFHAVRRDITLNGGAFAWFDEDLETKNLGPARGSGVVIKIDGRWVILQYNLAITVPNDRFKAVKLAIQEDPTSAMPSGPRGAIHGVVTLKGKAPVRTVPVKRALSEFCKDTPRLYNGIVVDGEGHLKDAFVRISPRAFKGAPEPTAPAVIAYDGCELSPRVQGVVTGGTLEIANLDGTLHNVHVYKRTETWFNQAIPRGTRQIEKTAPDEEGVMRFSCDVHPWERGFIIATDHPFYAVTKATGEYTIAGVPPGHYTVQAWHSRYGWKDHEVEVADRPVALDFDYKGNEPEPAENKDELQGVF